MAIKDGARVRIKDQDGGYLHGTVMSRRDDGLCVVKWDSSVAERIHESELEDVTGTPQFKEKLQELWDKMVQAGR